MRNPYDIIKSRYVTEKTAMLEQLQTAESNRSVARCKSPKYVFIVAHDANKQEIAQAIETIYKEKNVRVTQVNTLHVKSKAKRRGRGRGRPGKTAGFKKAIVTFEEGDQIENI